ncbi:MULTISPECIES: trypsin-like serine peptidase [unclassified Streptomyces]|uniref:trypsin-like serine peptidase n=1 Tax=unclassified Streptomyces TaxID=2593676 RepID=UPI002E1F4D25|nr:trypsin-like serine protease [Streptomyces sp. NBC_01023]
MAPKDRKLRRPLTLVVVGALALLGYASQAETSSAQRRADSRPGMPGAVVREQDQSPSALVSDGTAYTPLRTQQNARVGVLFEKDDTGNHFCTASIVASPGRNMLITAAHCAFYSDGTPKDDLVFAPAYRAGEKPAGLWKVKKAVADNRWSKNADPDLDVAFLLLDSNDGNRIQNILGANTLGINRGFHNTVKVTGYPNNRDTPISCRNRTTRFSATQMRIHCTNFAGGTSGSPWVTDGASNTDPGTVIGVLGGYQRGGNEDDVSYASYFDQDIADLYQQAKAQD